MRMWLVPTEYMCRKHLLGEHVEIHMLLGCLNKRKNIQGYLDKQLVFPKFIVQRHEDVAREMVNRGYNHRSPIELTDAPVPQIWQYTSPFHTGIDKHNMILKNVVELHNRCENCAKRIKEHEKERWLKAFQYEVKRLSSALEITREQAEF